MRSQTIYFLLGFIFLNTLIFLEACSETKSLSPVYCGKADSILCRDITRIDDALRNSHDYQKQSYGVFFTNTAINQSEVQMQLEKSSQLDQNSAYMGVSAWENFDFAAVKPPHYFFLVDINTATIRFNTLTIETVKKVSTRFQFVEHFIQTANEIPYTQNHWLPYVIRTMKNRGDFEINDHLPMWQKEIRMELQRKGSWLSSKKSFDTIKNLIEFGNVYVFHYSLANEIQTRLLSQTLAQHGIKLNILCISNVLEWIKNKKNTELFAHTMDNINFIVSPGTKLIAMSNVARREEGMHFAYQQKILIKKINALSYSDILQPKLSSAKVYKAVHDSFLRKVSE
ncbi:MAG: hypothetical protein KC505_05360 [Myxococcales bacterium]|nr:hypothetical protein [Myxococcales bacterium]USN51504.1 MAG: hypothetical protein H6731_03615 [Myxococcales bacterium]